MLGANFLMILHRNVIVPKLIVTGRTQYVIIDHLLCCILHKINISTILVITFYYVDTYVGFHQLMLCHVIPFPTQIGYIVLGMTARGTRHRL